MSDFVAESRERLNVREAQAVVAEIKQIEAASDNQREVRNYTMMIELRRRLDVAHRGPSHDLYSQLQDAELLHRDLASWSETRSDLEKQEQRLLETMGVGGALSQIPAFINVRQESVWLDREIARLNSELGLGK